MGSNSRDDDDDDLGLVGLVALLLVPLLLVGVFAAVDLGEVFSIPVPLLLLLSPLLLLLLFLDGVIHLMTLELESIVLLRISLNEVNFRRLL